MDSLLDILLHYNNLGNAMHPTPSGYSFLVPLSLAVGGNGDPNIEPDTPQNWSKGTSARSNRDHSVVNGKRGKEGVFRSLPS